MELAAECLLCRGLERQGSGRVRGRKDFREYNYSYRFRRQTFLKDSSMCTKYQRTLLRHRRPQHKSHAGAFDEQALQEIRPYTLVYFWWLVGNEIIWRKVLQKVKNYNREQPPSLLTQTKILKFPSASESLPLSTVIAPVATSANILGDQKPKAVWGFLN